MSYGAVVSQRRQSYEEEEDQREALLAQDNEDDIKVDMPEIPHLTRSEEQHIPDEWLKTFVCLLFMGVGFIATTFSIALTHERVPDYDPLPDVILDHVQYREWGLHVSEVLIVVNMVLAVVVVVLHKHRTTVLRRIFVILGLLYMYRSVTMSITVLPKSDRLYPCAPKLNHTITFSELMSRVLTIAAGGGLSLNGTQKYCGDFIFSGHTMVLMMAFFVIREYSPRTRKFMLVHTASLCLSVTGVVMLLLCRGHYSIDCLVAYWVTSRVWWTYHTLASNNSLQQRGPHNHLDNIWWWYILIWSESNIPDGRLPRRYDLPLPSNIKQRLSSRWRAWRLRDRADLQQRLVTTP